MTLGVSIKGNVNWPFLCVLHVLDMISLSRTEIQDMESVENQLKFAVIWKRTVSFN